MVIRQDKYTNFRLTTFNQNDINSSEELFSRLNLGNRLIPLKKAFLLNLLLNLKQSYSNSEYLLIPLNKNKYRNLTENQKVNYQTHDIVDATVKELLRIGYIRKRTEESFKATDGSFSVKPAGYFPTDRLMPYLNGIEYSDIKLLRPKSFLVLKQIEDYNSVDDKEVEVEFKETKLTKKLKQDLEQYNDLREKSELSVRNLSELNFMKHKQKSLIPISADDLNSLSPVNRKYSFKLRNSYLSRIFNRTFKRGGRFYKGAETNMPSDVRKHLYIDGKPTVEYDYAATHFMMLYNLKGVQLRKDPYMVAKNMSKQMRKIYKTVGFIALNAKSKVSALKALWKHFNKDENKELLPENSKEDRLHFIDSFIKHNKKIESVLYKEKCHMLTNYDSKIAHDILMHFANKGILVLCVHDSFIIQRRYAKELFKMMKKFYKDRFGFNPKIEKK